MFYKICKLTDAIKICHVDDMYILNYNSNIYIISDELSNNNNFYMCINLTDLLKNNQDIDYYIKKNNISYIYLNLEKFKNKKFPLYTFSLCSLQLLNYFSLFPTEYKLIPEQFILSTGKSVNDNSSYHLNGVSAKIDFIVYLLENNELSI